MRAFNASLLGAGSDERALNAMHDEALQQETEVPQKNSLGNRLVDVEAREKSLHKVYIAHRSSVEEHSTGAPLRLPHWDRLGRCCQLSRAGVS